MAKQNKTLGADYLGFCAFNRKVRIEVLVHTVRFKNRHPALDAGSYQLVLAQYSRGLLVLMGPRIKCGVTYVGRDDGLGCGVTWLEGAG